MLWRKRARGLADFVAASAQVLGSSAVGYDDGGRAPSELFLSRTPQQRYLSPTPVPGGVT